MLHSLAEVIPAVSDHIAATGRIALFLDFDGTLVRIEPDPAAPRLDPETAETLKSIARQDGVVTTIISGRAVEDLWDRIRLRNLIYAGNHGLEILGRNLSFVEPQASARRAQLESLCEELSEELRHIAGAIVEYKGLTATVHYRRAAETDLAEIQRAVYAAVARYGKLFRVGDGNKVYEILPHTNWHKGAAARWILQRLGRQDTSVIYLGDDTTDEDAFRALPKAITIRVGAALATCARFRLPDPTAVHEFLSWLVSWERVRPHGA
jgi:trehalose 6-phosphate phosphatase